MEERTLRSPDVPVWRALAIALLGNAVAVVLRSALDGVFGDKYPFIFAFAAVAAAAGYGGWRAASLATIIGYLAHDWFFVEPRHTFALSNDGGAITAFASFLLTCAIITALAERMRRIHREANDKAVKLNTERERLRVTLASIGDGVVATDEKGIVTFLNPVAVTLTGWTMAEAEGKALSEVVRIVNEKTRKPAGNPVEKVLTTGKVVGLANHTALIAKDGTEKSIADSAAPILSGDGKIRGVILVFRDVTQERLDEEARQKRAERAQLLSQILEGLLAAQEPDTIVRDFCPKVAAHVQADAYFNFMVNAEGDALRLHAAAGVPETVLVSLERLELGEAVCGLVAQTGKPIAALDIQNSSDQKTELIRQCGIQAYACNPLAAGGRLLGTLSFGSRQRKSFDEDELEFMRTVSHHFALAVDRLRAARALAERGQQLSEQTRLLDLSNDAIIVCDWEDRIRYWNHGAEEIYGWTREEAIGRIKYELLHTEYQEPRPQVLETLAREKRWQGELLHTRRDGARITVYTRWVLDRESPGKSASILKSDNDITIRKKAEEALRRSEERLRLVADHIPALVSYIDSNLIFRFANAAYEEWFGKKPAQLLGMHTRELLGDDLFRRREPYIERALRGELTRFEGETHHHALGWRHTEIVYIPRKSGGQVAGFYVFVHDITERVLSQRMLEQQAQSLRDAARRKDEFLAMLAHELRNPLASVSNAVALLRESEDAENRAWALDVLHRQAGQLSRLIDDLLDVSRITSGKIRLRKTLVDAAAILRTAAEAAQPLIQERNHQLIVDVLDHQWALPVEADPTRLEQIISNLLTNAAKYTEAGGTIWLSARREENAAGAAEILISVRDTGIGIPPEKISEMFELFAQGERSIARSEGGLGVGLTIVRKLTEMHGGTVSAYSEGAGKGSEFLVRIPAAAASARPDLSHPGNGEDTPSVNRIQTRILVVDDNVDTARSLDRLLRLSGYTVRLAHNGVTALEAAREFAPHFVLLDIGLPALDGYEVCRRLREEENIHPVIIAISGYGQDEDRRRTSAAGFAYHLVKPVDIVQLRALLADPRHRCPI